MNILRVIIKSRNCCVGVQNQIFNEEYSSFNTFLNARQNYHHYVFIYSSFFLVHTLVTKNARVHSQYIIHCNQFMNKTCFIACFCDVLSVYFLSFLRVVVLLVCDQLSIFNFLKLFIVLLHARVYQNISKILA